MRRLSILVVVLLTLLGFAPAAHAGSGTPPGLPQSVAAAGDSITRGFDATLFGCFLTDCPAYSGSTGTSSTVSSHYSRIRAAQPGVAAPSGCSVNSTRVELPSPGSSPPGSLNGAQR